MYLVFRAPLTPAFGGGLAVRPSGRPAPSMHASPLAGTMISVYTPNGIWAGGDYDFTRANAAHGTEAAWWARVGEFPMCVRT